MSHEGYDRLLELVAENPGPEAEAIMAEATDEDYDAEDTHGWLETALATEDVFEFDGKHWIVRKGRFS